MFDLGAVGVENAIAEIRVRTRGAFDQEDLVGADAEVPVAQGAGALGRHFDGLADAVEHDEIIARAMHFGEVPVHHGIIAHYWWAGGAAPWVSRAWARPGGAS